MQASLSAGSGPSCSEPRGLAPEVDILGQFELFSEVRGSTLGSGSLSWEVQVEAAGQLTLQLPEQAVIEEEPWGHTQLLRLRGGCGFRRTQAQALSIHVFLTPGPRLYSPCTACLSSPLPHLPLFPGLSLIPDPPLSGASRGLEGP